MLLYTGSSDAEGTLGGLVQFGQHIHKHIMAALGAIVQFRRGGKKSKYGLTVCNCCHPMPGIGCWKHHSMTRFSNFCRPVDIWLLLRHGLTLRGIVPRSFIRTGRGWRVRLARWNGRKGEFSEESEFPAWVRTPHSGSIGEQCRSPETKAETHMQAIPAKCGIPNARGVRKNPLPFDLEWSST